MELYDVMRTTFSARAFTDEPVPDEAIERILENARFASSGGNRQGWRVIVVREQATKEAIADLAIPGSKRYAAQNAAGEGPWNPVAPPTPTAAEIEATAPPPGLNMPYRSAPVLLVVCVDLRVVAAVDQLLDRVGIIAGASVYPFTWNILLAARAEGYGATLTTMPIAQEPKLKELLHVPDHVAVCAILPFGVPQKQLTKLKRKPVREIAMRETFDGAPFTTSATP